MQVSVTRKLWHALNWHSVQADAGNAADSSLSKELMYTERKQHELRIHASENVGFLNARTKLLLEFYCGR